MAKKILIINGHPNKESLNLGFAEAYKKGVLETNAEVKVLTISHLKFNPNLEFGYQRRTELEPDLLEAWEKIKWADHLVWIHPRSEEHTSELQSRPHLVCRLLLEKKKKIKKSKIS